MLQLSGTLRSATVRLTPLSWWRIHNQQAFAACSGAANPNPIALQLKEDEPQSRKPTKINVETIKSKNPMIQAVFNTLKVNRFGPENIVQTTVVTAKIKNAKTIDNLLKIADNEHITRDNAFAIVTQLVDWVNNNKATLGEFEMDTRFLRLCTLLSQPQKPVATQEIPDYKREARTRKYLKELNLFYGMNEINEATKEVANITVEQMVKVMSALASQKRRTTPLLRSLSFNISRSQDSLNTKQLSDLLYSMAILNYPDEVLLQKVCADLMLVVKDVEKTAMIGSILTSLGMLRYKNEQLMDELSEWAVRHVNDMRAQDLCSLFMTLAMLGYTPSNISELNKILIEPLKEGDMTKPAEWLDIIWAFTVLGLAQNRHIASVLDSNFIRKIADSYEIPVPKKHKLLNINGAAQFLLKDYEGPLLESNSKLFNVAIQRSKVKQIFVTAVTVTLENIWSPPQYLKTNIDTGMGFLLDAELCIDAEGKRLPVESDVKENKGFRIAVFVQSYHDFCRGKQDPLGFHNLYCRILEAKGYKILSIPHTEFRAEDKIVQRLAYVNDRIKALAK